MYLHVVLGIFQKARPVMEGRSSPLKALVIAPSPKGENASRSQPSCLAHVHGFSDRASFPLPTWAPYHEWGLHPPRRERCSGINIPGSYPSPVLLSLPYMPGRAAPGLALEAADYLQAPLCLQRWCRGRNGCLAFYSVSFLM